MLELIFGWGRKHKLRSWVSYINQLIIGQLDMNSLRNKCGALENIVSGNLHILVVTESKINESFPDNQFCMDGYSRPFRSDRDAIGGFKNNKVNRNWFI